MSRLAWTIAAVIAVLLAAAAYLTSAFTVTTSTPAAAPETTSTNSTPDTETTPPTPAPSVGSTSAGTVTEQDWYPTALGFATDYAAPGDDSAAWVARLKRWCAPQLLDGFATTDIRTVTTATDPDITITGDTPTYVDAHAVYDTGAAIVFRITPVGATWQVTGVDRAADDNPTP